MSRRCQVHQDYDRYMKKAAMLMADGYSKDHPLTKQELKRAGIALALMARKRHPIEFCPDEEVRDA